MNYGKHWMYMNVFYFCFHLKSHQVKKKKSLGLPIEIFKGGQWILVNNLFFFPLRPSARCEEGCGNEAEKAYFLCSWPTVRILALRRDIIVAIEPQRSQKMSLLITEKLDRLHVCSNFKLARAFYFLFRLYAETCRGSKV